MCFDEGELHVYGEAMPEDQARRLSEKNVGRLLLRGKHSGGISPARSLYDFLVDKLQGDEELGWSEKKIVLQMAEQWGAYIYTPITRQSLKCHFLEASLDGG
jgi:hypothetical protein